jgi:hypothetical protein
MTPNQYTRPGSNTVPIAVNDVVLITTPEGTTHPSGCGCGSCSGGGGAVTGAQGTQGVRGPQGTTGLQGPAGIGGAAVDNTDDVPEGTTNKYFTVGRVSFEHIQGVASATWTIVHNLKFYPNVTVQDSAGNIVEGEISYTNSDSLVITFSAAFSGTAYLS